LKYIMVVGDGMADYPVDELDGRTPLEVARHVNMDRIVSQGICGTLQTIPPGMDTGSDVAMLTILGYNPRIYHTGRGPLEAVAAGVSLGDNDVAFRCNLITEKNGVLADYSAGHITTDEAASLIKRMNENFGLEGKITFQLGVSYRHILVLRGKEFSDSLESKAPHDVVGRRISEVMLKPKSRSGTETANLLNRLMAKSKDVLSGHPVNLRRVENGKNPGNMVWLWSPGRKPEIPSIREQYGVKGAIISAVNIVKGIGLLTGMDVIEVPGATGYFDTDYEGKADYALRGLEKHDMVVIHVEAPDEAAHLGDPNLKIRAIEDLDERLIGRLMGRLEGDYVISVLTDHATPIRVRTHTGDPVPFAIYSTAFPKTPELTRRFNERTAINCSLRVGDASQFMNLFLRPTLRTP